MVMDIHPEDHQVERILSPLIFDHETGFLCVAQGTTELSIGVAMLGNVYQAELPTVDVMRTMLSIMTPKQLEQHRCDVVERLIELGEQVYKPIEIHYIPGPTSPPRPDSQSPPECGHGHGRMSCEQADQHGILWRCTEKRCRSRVRVFWKKKLRGF